jgi:phage terminase large subunit-like protein
MKSENGASARSSTCSASPQALRELQTLLETEKRRRERSRLLHYAPYAKQRAFHAAGAIHRERLLMAANQVGKTWCGAAEMAFHLTGRYPHWWSGRRFAGPVRAWAGSQTLDVTRDGVQRVLVGEPRDEANWGTGMIPGDDIIDWSRRRGAADALDGLAVRHISGGTSTLGFKSYDQGRAKWQADTLDAVWFDEEPPPDVYGEGLTRTNATGGIVWLTFTPLLGVSEVVRMFLDGCGEAIDA